MTNKYAEFTGQPQKPIKVWKAALYIRLSREDEDTNKVESNSVTSQREFLREYLKQHPEIEPYDYYVDDGWSGTNFDRPDFQRMIMDIHKGLVDCVIVKDLSRLGRNAAETGNYIDNVFARLQIRFIAIHNYIDTAEGNMNAATHCITVGIQNVINESVAATTSVNVRGTLNVERQQGKFIGAFATYGYKKDENDRHQLIIDEDAANVVRQIYKWFINGKSILGIVKELNGRGIPNPSSYKKMQGLKYTNRYDTQNDGYWSDRTVRRMLQNEMYIGNMVQGKYTTISYKHRQCRPVPKEDWYVVQNTHEPIIDEDTFKKAQSLFNRGIRKSPLKNDVDLFAGLVRCGDCNRIMSKKTNKFSYGTYCYYRCTTSQKIKKGECTNHTIRLDKLESAVTVTIQKMIDTATEMSEIIDEINKNPKRNNKSNNLANALKKAKNEKERITNIQMDLYPDWKNGIITQKEYIRLKGKFEEEIQSLDENIKNMEKSILDFENGKEDDNSFLDNFKKYGNIKKLTRPLLTELVEKILVFEDGKIEVVFKYKDEFLEATEYININKQDKKSLENQNENSLKNSNPQKENKTKKSTKKSA